MNRRTMWLVGVAVAVLVIILVLVGLVLATRGSGSGTADNPGGGDVGGGAAPANAQADKQTATQLPVQLAKLPPPEQPFHGCPGTGDGGDPVLNTLKNRTDTGNWTPVAFDALEKLAWPHAAERTKYDSWSKDVRAQIDKYNGIPVQIEGYLFAAHKQGPESNNCHAAGLTDFHIWLTAGPKEDRTASIVVEMTPRMLEQHPKWTVDVLNQIAHNNERVRVSGWTMFDPEHPDQVTKTRGTIWEIHPVMQLEVMRDGRWQSLDDLK
ncbi:MAG TPA: hypothetical protein VKV26_20525 [Dehalococcoidia bacterium]|nr:hypothetical protein [Dehalococcoidia bacterium]